MLNNGSRITWINAERLVVMAMAVLCLLGIGVDTPLHAAGGKRVALIIGNANYTSGGSLPNPANDASLIARKAREAGFEVTPVDNLKLETFRRALVDFRLKADSAEVALVYYAGHGIEANGENWLIPVDAMLADPRDLSVQAIRLSDVINDVSRAKLRVILLDACRDNPFKEKWASATRSFQTGLERVEATDGSLVIFAADRGSAISDGQEGSNSYFAQALAKRLVEPGLPLQILGNKVGDDVRAMSGGIQRPFQSNSLTGIEYYLVAKAGDPDAGMDSDDGSFLKAQQVNTAQAYLGYLTKFPNGKSRQIAASLYSALSRAMGLGTNTAVVSAAGENSSSVPQPVQAPSPASQFAAPASPSLPGSAGLSVAASVPAVTSQTITPAQQSASDGFPLLPDPPAFSLGAYPTCKDRWKSVTDPSLKVQATIECKDAYSNYRVTWLNKYRDSMNDNVALANKLYNEQVAPRANHPGRFERVSQFQRDVVQRGQDVADGGRLMVAYEAALARWKADFSEVEDSYDRATGCRGYPTPEGLAKNPYCASGQPIEKTASK